MNEKKEERKRKNRKTKTLLERVTQIFEFMTEQDRPIYKSDLRAIGLSSKNAEQWIEIIRLIQSQPKLIISRVKDNLIIELESIPKDNISLKKEELQN